MNKMNKMNKWEKSWEEDGHLLRKKHNHPHGIHADGTKSYSLDEIGELLHEEDS